MPTVNDVRHWTSEGYVGSAHANCDFLSVHQTLTGVETVRPWAMAETASAIGAKMVLNRIVKVCVCFLAVEVS